jgi:hypothetical protein
MSVCPRASICAEDPSLCQQRLEGAEFVTLSLLLVGPVMVSLLLPCLASRTRRPSHREVDKAISPELCDPCGLPEVCASSGVLAALATLAFTIIPVSFLLLLTPQPCDTAFGGCGSISCVCGSYYIQGCAPFPGLAGGFDLHRALVVTRPKPIPARP